MIKSLVPSKICRRLCSNLCLFILSPERLTLSHRNHVTHASPSPHTSTRRCGAASRNNELDLSVVLHRGYVSNPAQCFSRQSFILLSLKGVSVRTNRTIFSLFCFVYCHELHFSHALLLSSIPGPLHRNRGTLLEWPFAAYGLCDGRWKTYKVDGEFTLMPEVWLFNFNDFSLGILVLVTLYYEKFELSCVIPLF